MRVCPHDQFANLPSHAFASKYAVGMDKQVNEDALCGSKAVEGRAVNLCPSLQTALLYRPPLYVLSEEIQKNNYLDVRPSPSSGVAAAFVAGVRAQASNAIMDRLQRRRKRMPAACSAAAAGQLIRIRARSRRALVLQREGESGVEMMSREEKTTSSRDAENLQAASKTMDKFGKLHELLLSKKY